MDDLIHLRWVALWMGMGIGFFLAIAGKSYSNLKEYWGSIGSCLVLSGIAMVFGWILWPLVKEFWIIISNSRFVW